MRKKSESVLIRIAKAPLRALCRARDLYVRSMTGCAGRIGNSAMGYPGGGAVVLPRSFSSQPLRRSCSSDEDFRELVRAASQGAMGSLNRRDHHLPPAAVRRSQSVAIARIDEDKPCVFDGSAAAAAVFYPRSKSHVVPATRVGPIR